MHYKSVFDDEQELLKAILELHVGTPTFDLDPMYFKGNFYKSIPEPKYKFDISPVVLGCEQGDARNLPLKDSSASSMILDPPFMFGNHGKQRQYYSARTHTMYDDYADLLGNYQGIIKEAKRVLKPKGILVFKCQDFTDSKTTMTHILVHNLAVSSGFYAKDIAILVKPLKVWDSTKKQRHFRKIHTYFWVFQVQSPKNFTPKAGERNKTGKDK